MGSGIDFKGSNKRFGPPEGMTEDEVKTLSVFMNGNCIVSCWQLTADESAEVASTGKVWLSVWSGLKLFPVFVGSETATHGLVSQFGEVWKIDENNVAQPMEGSEPTDAQVLAAATILNLYALHNGLELNLASDMMFRVLKQDPA